MCVTLKQNRNNSLFWYYPHISGHFFQRLIAEKYVGCNISLGNYHKQAIKYILQSKYLDPESDNKLLQTNNIPQDSD